MSSPPLHPAYVEPVPDYFASKISRAELADVLGFRPKDMTIYWEAFMHASLSSYLEQNRDHEHVRSLPPFYFQKSLERLEFLGDAVLQKSVTRFLFDNFQEEPEGKLTVYRSNIVRKQTLAKIATSLKLDKWIQMSPSARYLYEQRVKAKASTLEDCLEALVGAIELDRGDAFVQQFIYEKCMSCLSLEDITEDRNFKMWLFQLCQKRKWSTPSFEIIKTEGPTNDRTFYMEIILKPYTAEELEQDCFLEKRDKRIGPVASRRVIDGEQELCRRMLQEI